MKTLEELKRVLRKPICDFCPLGEKDEPCTLEERGPNSAMCDTAKDNRAEYIWEHIFGNCQNSEEDHGK